MGPTPAIGVVVYDPAQDALAIVERPGDGQTEVRVQDGTLQRLAHWSRQPGALEFDRHGHLVQVSSGRAAASGGFVAPTADRVPRRGGAPWIHPRSPGCRMTRRLSPWMRKAR